VNVARKSFRQRPRFGWLLGAALLCALTALPATPQAQEIKPAHGLAMHGDLKYPPDFKHFDYVNPNAPKGGSLRLSEDGTFDTLNGFVLKGVAAAGTPSMYDTLMTNSDDEAFTEYGLIAESIEVPEDRSWAIFNLRPQARFHDGAPITADDVVFTFDLIRSKGHPQLRFYYASIAKVEKLGDYRVKFTFNEGGNRELPLIIGQQPILPKHYWESRDFERATLEPPIGSGPYRIDSFETGRDITYRRDPNYWGRDLPVNVGRYNFDTIRYDYFRDPSVEFEAFKAGQYDFRPETTARIWAIGYDFPAVRRGLVKKEEIEHHRPSGMQGYVYNTRRPLFADPKVRNALAYAFDFEWTNQRLFFGAYTRSESYFSNSELAAVGLPKDEELALLEKHRDEIPPEVFTEPYSAPKTDGSGMARNNLLTGLKMLQEAGWKVRPEDGIMTDTTGQPVEFEILLNNPAFERVTGPFVRNLKRLGIEARIRTVDTAQYKNRIDNWDFDLTVWGWGQSLSPGNEQRSYWSSQSADTPGSRNLAGIKDPVIDELIELLIAAPDRTSLVNRTRALDRMLLWGHYVIPHWHVRVDRVAYWDKFEHPDVIPDAGYQIETWWVDPSREGTVARAKEQAAAETSAASAHQSQDAAAPPARSGHWIYFVIGIGAAALLAFALWRVRRVARPRR
jgi:microcin C transport system substrate-binding protein